MNNYDQPWKRILLDRYHERYFKRLTDWKNIRGYSWRKTADILGIDHSHLGKVRRKELKLSMVYVMPAILQNIIKVEDFYMENGQTEKERQAWSFARVLEKRHLLKLISELEDDGIDVEAVLTALKKKGTGP